MCTLLNRDLIGKFYVCRIWYTVAPSLFAKRSLSAHSAMQIACLSAYKSVAAAKAVDGRSLLWQQQQQNLFKDLAHKCSRSKSLFYDFWVLLAVKNHSKEREVSWSLLLLRKNPVLCVSLRKRAPHAAEHTPAIFDESWTVLPVRRIDPWRYHLNF